MTSPAGPSLTRVAVVCDLLEEKWPSMDLVADMLVTHLQQDYAQVFEVTRICPPMRRRFTGSTQANGKRLNADRFLNRFWDYPQLLKQMRSEFDLFHVLDHSYGQLLHQLPPERTVITCHDLDTFRCLLAPTQETRSVFFKRMMERTLSGFRQAARVTCDSVATRAQLLAHDLVPAERAFVVPNGVHPLCSPQPDAVADALAAKMIGATAADEINILHVGSTIPRKRIDVLLQVFASVRKVFPRARLLRVGGAFTAEQTQLLTKLKLRESIVQLPEIDRSVLAAFYRQASLVLLPSEREGFGLPLVEAMACGTPVVVSDLDVLREVGGEVAAYCPVAEVSAWSEKVAQLLDLKCTDGDEWNKLRLDGIIQASKFTWSGYATKMVHIYESLLQ